METSAVITATTTTATIVDNRITRRSLCLAKYIKNIQQANKKTAIEHRYRLSRFERYIARVFEQIQQLQQQQQHQNQEHQNQDQELERTRAAPLDQLIEELKSSSSDNKNLN
jgi:uncharacterized protein (UPF0305 family)